MNGKPKGVFIKILNLYKLIKPQCDVSIENNNYCWCYIMLLLKQFNIFL